MSKPPVPVAATTSLQPALRMALGSLNLRLEDELVRYRRQRRTHSATTPPKRQRSSTNKALDLLSLGTTRLKLSSPGSQNKQQATRQQRRVRLRQLQEDANPQQTGQTTTEIANSAIPSWPATEVNNSVAAHLTPASVANSANKQEEPELLVGATSPLSPSPIPPGHTGQRSMQHEASSIILATHNQSESDIAADAQQQILAVRPKVNENLVGQSTLAPDDYLESTEELIRGLNEQEQAEGERSQRRGLLDLILSPLGIGALLILLASGAAAVYALMNPWLFDRRLAAETEMQPNSLTTANNASPEGREELTPDLTAKEFVNLNLRTLGTLPKTSSASDSNLPDTTQAQSSGAAQLSRLSGRRTNQAGAGGVLSNFTQSLLKRPADMGVAPSTLAPSARSTQSSNNAATARTSSSVPTPLFATPPVSGQSTPTAHASAPHQAAALPKPQPVSTAPKPTPTASLPPVEPQVATSAPELPTRRPASEPTAAQPSPVERYYVVTPYTGDAALTEAQDLVPDAYVRNFSNNRAQIQLGSFDTEDKARSLLESLSQQGLSVDVYKP